MRCTPRNKRHGGKFVFSLMKVKTAFKWDSLLTVAKSSAARHIRDQSSRAQPGGGGDNLRVGGLLAN